MNPGSVPPDVAPLALVVSPSERLAMSRERLRQAMRPKRAADSPRAARGAGSPDAWLGSFKAHPVGAILLDTVSRWWSQHPLRLVSMVAADATSAVVRPMAQRNPMALVLGALVVGGLMAWSRPWRWLLTPALLAGLVPRIFSKALAMVPPQSWMAMLAALTQDDQRPPPSSAQPPQTTPPSQSPEMASTARAASPARDRSQSAGVGSKNE